jgi:hypothetical protein
MQYLKLVIPSTILLTGLFVCVSSMFGTPEFAKKEKKSCTTCHTKVTSDKNEMVKSLNATGTCYKENDHSLAKCTVK